MDVRWNLGLTKDRNELTMGTCRTRWSATSPLKRSRRKTYRRRWQIGGGLWPVPLLDFKSSAGPYTASRVGSTPTRLRQLNYPRLEGEGFKFILSTEVDGLGAQHLSEVDTNPRSRSWSASPEIT